MEEKADKKAQESELRKQIKELRATLTELNNVKESYFVKRREVSAKIGSFAREIKEARQERDQLTDHVKEFKEARTDLNQQIKDKINAVKNLQKKKDELRKKYGIKSDPLRIKKQIDRINTRVETEALSFDKEKELMKALKGLKKEYASCQELTGVLTEISTLSKEIDELKNKANTEHRQIQQQATQSQEKHLAMLDSAKNLDDLRKEEADIDKHITEKKAEIKHVSTQLEEKLKTLAEITGETQALQRERRKQHESNIKKKLAERQAEVNDKLKKGLTLTTEDLLILQQTDDDSDQE